MLQRIFMVISATAVLLAQQPVNPSRSVDLLLGKARALEARGRLDLAAQAWQQLLMMEPGQQDAIAGLARAAKARGDEAEAAAFIDKLKKANPANPAIHQIEAAVKKVKSNPQLQEAARLAQAGQPDKAVAAYRAAFGSNTPPIDWAMPYYETLAGTPGGWEQATAAIEELVRKNPSVGEYKLVLGRLYTYRPATRLKGASLLESLTGEYAQSAQKAWKQALTWEAGSPRSAESLRRYLSRYPDADLQAAVRKASSGDGLVAGEDLREAYQSLKADQLDTAEKLFIAATEKSPKEAGAHAGLGFVRMKRQDFSAAVTSFETAASLARTNRVVQDALKEARFWKAMQQGSVALQASRSEDAVTAFKNAVSERPNDLDAIQGYAGALMSHGDYAKAVPMLERLTKADSTQARNWMNLVIAKHRTLGAQAAMEAAAKVPAEVAAKLGSSAEYMIVLANLHKDAGRDQEARRAFAAAAVLAERQADLPSYVQISLADFYSQLGESARAGRIYREVIEREPSNLDGWEGYLLTSNRTNDAAEALNKLQGLPVPVHEAAQARPSFLRAVAMLQTSVGNLAVAEKLLNQALAAETTKGQQPSFSTELQTGQLWLEQGKSAQAARKFLTLTHSFPQHPEVWKSLLLAHQKAGAWDEASAAMRKVPAAVASQLEADPDYVGVVASIYKETKTSEETVNFLEQATSRISASGRLVPADLTAQLGWLLLDKPGSERELFLLLRNTRTRTDLSTEQRRKFDEIWAAWFMKSADKAMKADDSARAVAILEAGLRMLPADLHLQRALAASLLTHGDANRALAAYRAAGLKGATSGDYRAAIGASIAAQEPKLADQWLREGLTKFPSDHELLSLAGKQAAAKGNFKKAEAFWRLALEGLNKEEHARVVEGLRSGPEGIKDLKAGNPADDAGALLLRTAQLHSTDAPAAKKTITERLPWDTVASSGAQAASTATMSAAEKTRSLLDELLSTRDLTPAAPKQAAPILTTSLTPTVGRESAGAAESRREIDRMLDSLDTREGRTDLKRSIIEKPQAAAAPIKGANTGITVGAQLEEVLPDVLPQAVALLLEPKAPITQFPERERMLDRIKTIEGRNSPFVGVGGNVQTRNGQAGFERMMLQESVLESSNILSGRIRATIVAKSVFLDSASPDGESLLQFGMLPRGDTFEAPSANGFGADLQLSGTNFGMHIGSTPRGFLVRNVTGGFNIRPGGGPISLTFDRDSVRDTILAYAGVRDPLTKRVWGGVIANTGAVAGNWGDQKSGAYFNLGFQHLTGESVQTNRRIDGTLGTYWQLASNSAGSLKAGVNLFAMHYAKNLRFFTMGHGGYFSPQRFFLFNVPVNWSGKANRLQYVVGTSIGSQSFTEEASPFYPMDPLVQGKAGPFYPKLSSSGINYNIDFRTAYQVAENWFLVGFLNINNARFFSQQSAGISIKYSFRPRPLDSDLSIPAIPDWRGRQPFGIQ